MPEASIVVAGVGGQGVLSASRLIAQAAILGGDRVFVGDTFGASQREGSVMSTVRIGAATAHPAIAPGRAHFLIAFEPYEALRRVHMLRPDGVVVASSAAAVPIRQQLEGGYPPLEAVWASLEERTRALCRISVAVQAAQLADKYASRFDATNVIIVGAASAMEGFPVSEALLRCTIEVYFTGSSLRMNLEALQIGRDAAASCLGRQP